MPKNESKQVTWKSSETTKTEVPHAFTLEGSINFGFGVNTQPRRRRQKEGLSKFLNFRSALVVCIR